MLARLSIQNYAIIDSLELSFSGELNVITGETGAGKSILAGALGLALGDRADAAVMIRKDRKCVVEALFIHYHEAAVQAFLEQHELDISEELTIRREISPNGKSRAFINDTPVNLASLQGIGTILVDLHRQFDTAEMGESSFQREVVDAMAGHSGRLLEFREHFLAWQNLHQEVISLRERKAASDREADYHLYLLRELEEADFRENEIEELEQKVRTGAQSGEILAAIEEGNQFLSGSETPVASRLKALAGKLENFTCVLPALTEITERLVSVQIELRDIADELARIGEGIDMDGARLEKWQDRLSEAYRLQKKHGVHDGRELLARYRELKEQEDSRQFLDEEIEQKEREAGALLEKIQALAGKISTSRHRQVRPLEEKVNALLVNVGMPNARLKVDIQTAGLHEWGADQVRFLFNANQAKGEKESAYQPLKKVASGGELNRLMLCIKSLVAEKMELPTLVFDEIDSGISGEAAKQVGAILRELATTRQLICITHQPQIAGKADKHFFVYKDLEKETVVTRVRALDEEERVNTIAQMLGGENPSAAALQHARELIEG